MRRFKICYNYLAYEGRLYREEINYQCLFLSKKTGKIFKKIEMIVKNHNAVLIFGTTSNKPAQSSAFKASAIRLNCATSVNAVKDKPIAIAN